jgi:hypothetical protein
MLSVVTCGSEAEPDVPDASDPVSEPELELVLFPHAVSPTTMVATSNADTNFFFIQSSF